MAGFENQVMIAKNINFDQFAPKPHFGIIDAAGKFPIGSGNSSPLAEILGGTLISPLGTLTIGYSSPNITIDVAGGSTAIDSIQVDASTPPGTNPVVPTVSGLVIMTGGQVANGVAGMNVIRIQSLAANTVEVDIQRSETSISSNLAVNGVCHFDVADFAVDTNGFVQLSGTGAGQTITGDTGGALSPTAGNWNILGGPGVTTTGSGSTLTINSVVFTDQAGSIAITSDSGSFTTNGAPIILDLPAAPAQGELIEIVCTTANAVAVDAPVGDFIRIGTLITSSGGTITSTDVGDAVVLRFNTANQIWYATSVIGTWLVA